MSTAPATVDGPLLTADGVPLKASLEKSLRRSRMRALILVAPPLLFLIFLFVIPIGNMLTRSVDDNLINDVLPNTFSAFESWDKESEPSEAMFEAFYTDLKNAEKTQIGKASVRMNYAQPGWRSLIKRTARKIKKMEPPYKEAFLKADDRWTDNEFWLSLGIMKDKRTMGYYLNAVDRTYDFDRTWSMSTRTARFTTCYGGARSRSALSLPSPACCWPTRLPICSRPCRCALRTC